MILTGTIDNNPVEVDIFDKWGEVGWGKESRAGWHRRACQTVGEFDQAAGLAATLRTLLKDSLPSLDIQL